MSEQIYVVVTQTGTILSRILKVITHADYNHVSVSTDPTLNTIYSFGRKNPYNPFFGGFVRESPKFGTFKRFSETDAVVLAIPVAPELKDEMEAKLEDMYRHKKEYHYDTLGLLLAGVKIPLERDNTYYCSSFVKDFLQEYDLAEDEVFGQFPKPIEFLDLKEGHVVYRGKLREYEKTYYSHAN